MVRLVRIRCTSLNGLQQAASFLLPRLERPRRQILKLTVISRIIYFPIFLHQFPWLEHLRKVLSRPDLSKDEMVIVLANDYLQNMIDLLRKTDKK